MSELTIKGDIQKLRLKKGDYVIIKVKSGNVSQEQTMLINKQARELFPENKIIVLPDYVDIQVKEA